MPQQLHHVGELGAHPLLPPGEQLDLPVGGAVRLHPHAVVLVLGRAGAAQLGQDLRGVGKPLGQHHPRRVAGPDPQPRHRVQAAADQRGGHQPEVAADVVRPLQRRPVLPAAGVHHGQRVEDGRRPDAEPEVAGDQPQQVAALQRGGLRQQPG